MQPLSKQRPDADLHRATAQREVTERLRNRAELLAGEDRALLVMHLEAGSSFRQIARLMGMSPSTVARRIHKLLDRLSDETYALCLQRRDQFTEEELAVIRNHFVRGLSVQRICRDSSLCYYRARTIIAKARRVAEMVEAL